MTQTTTNQAAQVAGYLKQWMFDPNHAPHAMRPTPSFTEHNARNVNLKNSRERKFLQWEKQHFGINLGWTDDASPETAVRVSRWFFTRPADNQSPLRYGEAVALGYGVNPSYVQYAERTVGINLDWSTSPRFEWKLLGGPRAKRCGPATGWRSTTPRPATASSTSTAPWAATSAGPAARPGASRSRTR